MRMTSLLLLFCCFSLRLSLAQPSKEDAFFIKKIYNESLKEATAYKWLTYLSNEIGGRLSGSPQAAAAVEYTHQILSAMPIDSIWLQACEVPHWERGMPEIVEITQSARGTRSLNALSLGNSVGTPTEGLIGTVVEVHSLDTLDKMDPEQLFGKIIFFNRPMDPTQINTFAAYGGAVDQRVWGASRAAKHGAIAALIRSMTIGLDDIPHTGTMAYEEGVTKIPGIAISTNDAELLSRLLKEAPVEVFLKSNCQNLPRKISHNVIGEIKGSEYPEEIILVGGHLDSWDVGGGAHDDGAGCVQAMEVLYQLKKLNYQPKRTIRCVLFMNEENGLDGARTYQQASNQAKEYHLAAIESDKGGFTPRGFTCDGHKEIFAPRFKKLQAWLPLLEPYGIQFKKGGSGADISGLKSQKGMLFGLAPDTQRYFDIHHAQSDEIEAVNQRELQLGAAAMTSLVYLLDKYGLN